MADCLGLPQKQPPLATQIPLGLAVVLDPRLAADPVYGVSRLSLTMVTISSGYFLYDLGCCVTRLHVEGTAFLVHALCCLFVYAYAVFFGTLHWFGEQRHAALCTAQRTGVLSARVRECRTAGETAWWSACIAEPHCAHQRGAACAATAEWLVPRLGPHSPAHTALHIPPCKCKAHHHSSPPLPPLQARHSSCGS